MFDLLSVIIPIYNAEKTLSNCIESVVKQTYRNLEIILVDDGSTDSSRKICERWQKKDHRIRLSKPKVNGGLSNARNVGFRMAQGEYIAFVDSDDYIEKEMYKSMIHVLQEDGSDLVISNFVSHTMKESPPYWPAYPLKDDCLSSVETLKKMSLGLIPTSAWCKVLKRKVMDSEGTNIIQFPEGRRYEDTVVSFQQVIASEKISIIGKPLYHYIKNDNSITFCPNRRDIKDILMNTQELDKLLRGKIPDKIIECYLCETLIYALQLCIRTKCENSVKKDIQQKLREHINRVPYSTIFKSGRWKKLIVCKLRLLDTILNFTGKQR